MDLANTFEYKYERLESKELIAIVHNSRNFQPLAVETAYIELQRRVLSPEEAKQVTDDFNLYLKRKVTLETVERATPKPAQAKARRVRQPFFTAIKVINTISLTVLAIYLITLIQGDKAVLHMMIDSSNYRPSFIWIVVPYLALPFGAIGFGLKKQMGWIALTWVAMYNALKQAYFFINNVQIKLDKHYSDTISVDDIVQNAIVIAFFLLVAIVACLPNIRSKMNVKLPAVLLTTAAAVAFLILQVMKII
jgi:hypothetical protein